MKGYSIYRDNTIIYEFVVDDTISKSLSGNKYVSFTISSQNELDLKIGDYVLVGNEKYEIFEPIDIEESNGVFTYPLTFYFQGYKLNNSIITDEGATTFAYHGEVSDFMTLLIDSLNEDYPEFTLGTIQNGSILDLSFDNSNCMAALQTVCENAEMEWDITGTIITVKSRIGEETDHVFEYGRNKGSYSVKLAKVANSSVATRMIGKGGTLNLPADYVSPDSPKRLNLGNEVLEKNVNKYGKITGVYINENIYPRLINKTVLGVTTPDNIEEAGSWKIKLDIPFNLSDYYADNEVPVVKFQTGDLTGLDFEIVENSWNNTDKTLSIIVKEEEDGYYLPNANRQPRVGDVFVLLNINMPQSYIDEATQELREATQNELNKKCEPQYALSLSVQKHYIKKKGISLNIGDGITVKIGSRNITTRIIGTTETSDDIRVELGDQMLYTYNTKVNNTIEQIQFTLKQLINIDDIKRLFYNLINAWYPKWFNQKLHKNADVEFNSVSLRGDLKSNDFILGALGSGFGLLKKDSSGKSYLEVDKLYARLKATFSELEIRKLTYAGGNYVFSPAGVECIRVEDVISAYRLYFNANDGDKAVENLFRTDDLVQCRESNVKSGADGYTGNRYYWRRCVGTGADYIDLSKTDCDVDSDIPMEGDTVVTIGNRSNPERQNAIVISVYGEGSPSFMQYKGINNFTLEGKAKTIISPQLNQFTGKLIFTSGQDAETAIGDADKKADDARSSADEAAALAESAKAKAESAQQTAQDAQQAAATANAEIADMSSDSVISPVEKISLKEKWDVILSEKTKIDAQAINTGVSADDYDSAYNALYNLIGNNLKDLTTRWEIDGNTLRAAFTSYYDAKTVLLNTIAMVTKEKADAAASDAANAQAKADSAYSLSEKVSNSVDTILTGLIPDLQNQIDGNIQAWDGSEVPTLDNYPANQWTTPEEKERHIGDTYDYLFIQNGQQVSKRYKFRKVGNTFEWTLLSDSEGARLEVELRKTLGIANSKNSISYGVRPQPPYSIDDIWIDTNKCMYVCRVQREQDATGLESDWELVNDTQVRLRNMASDGVISKEEKPTYRNTLEQIKKEYATYNTTVTSVSKTALTSAYNNIVNYMTVTLKVTEDSDTNITEYQRNEFNTYLAAWYSSVTEFTNLIAGEEAGKAVDGLQIGSQNLISKKMMLKWNEKNKNIALWRQNEDGICLGISPELLYNDIATEALNPIFDIKFKANTQYVLSVEWKLAGVQSYSGLYLYILYTDGTSEYIKVSGAQTTKIRKDLVSQKGKTISKISSSFGSSTYKTYIYNISLIEGNKPLQGFPVAAEDQTGANNVNLADGTKEFTIISSKDQWNYNKLYVSKIKPNTVYYVNAQNIEFLSGNISKCNFVLYDKAIKNYLTITYHHLYDKNGGILITKNDFEAQEGYLLCYAGEAGHTIWNSVRFTEVMLVEGFLPAPVWTPSFSEQQNKIDAAKDAAEQAKADIAAMNDDNIFDISEKQTTRTTWENINGVASTEFTGTTGSYYKTKLEGSGLSELSELDTAYTNLRTYLNGILLYANSNTENFVRSEMAAKFTAYYDAEIAVNTAIADKLSKDAVGNIKLGGRNLATKSNDFKAGGGANGITSVRNEDGSITVTTAGGNGNWFTNFYAGNYSQIENSMNEGDDFTISFEMKSENSTYIPSIYIKQGMGYYTMLGNMSSAFSQVYYTGKWKKANNMQFHLGFSNLSGTFTIKNLKVEKGNKPTAWSPAIEDQDEKIDGLQGKITEHTETIAQLQAEDDNIRLSVNSVTTRVEVAKQEAINTAAADATNKASTAKQEAINTAAADATNKASTAKQEAEKFTLNNKGNGNNVATAITESFTIKNGYTILNLNTAKAGGIFTLSVATTKLVSTGTQTGKQMLVYTKTLSSNKHVLGYINATSQARQTITFTLPKNIIDGVYICATEGWTGINNVTKLKLEYGDKATDWTPSPEDQTQNTIKQTYRETDIDLTAEEWDQNLYYPVTIKLPVTSETRIEVFSPLDSSYGKPSWSTHNYGFSLLYVWRSNGSGWGSIGVKRTIEISEVDWTGRIPNTNPVQYILPAGSIGQMANSSNEFIYVRGGGRYKFRLTNNCIAVVHKDRYEIDNQSIATMGSVTAPVLTNVMKTEFDSQITILEKSINLRVIKTDYDKKNQALDQSIGNLETSYNSISGTVSSLNTRLQKVETAGFLTESKAVTLYAKKELENGKTIIGYINQTADTTTINAERINLNGAVVIGDGGKNSVSINDGKLTAVNAEITGKITATEGEIAGLKLSSTGLKSSDFNNVSKVGTCYAVDGFAVYARNNGILAPSSGILQAGIITATGDHASITGLEIIAKSLDTTQFTKVTALKLETIEYYSGTMSYAPVALEVVRGRSLLQEVEINGISKFRNKIYLDLSSIPNISGASNYYLCINRATGQLSYR